MSKSQLVKQIEGTLREKPTHERIWVIDSGRARDVTDLSERNRAGTVYHGAEGVMVHNHPGGPEYTAERDIEVWADQYQTTGRRRFGIIKNSAATGEIQEYHEIEIPEGWTPSSEAKNLLEEIRRKKRTGELVFNTPGERKNIRKLWGRMGWKVTKKRL